jgi:hypothetical protein
LSTTLLSTNTIDEVNHGGVTPKQAFMKHHRPEVQKDFRDAVKCNLDELLVTPWRCVDRSAVQKLTLTQSCKQLKWLKELYRAECPPGMLVLFEVKHYKAELDKPEYSTLQLTFVRES